MRHRETTHDFEIHTLQAFAPAVLHVRSRSRPRNAGACLNNVKQALRQGRRQDVVISVCVSRRCGVGSYDDFGFVEDSPPPFMSLRGFLLQPTFSSILSRSPSMNTAHACMPILWAPRWSVSRRRSLRRPTASLRGHHLSPPSTALVQSEPRVWHSRPTGLYSRIRAFRDQAAPHQVTPTLSKLTHKSIAQLAASVH